MLMSLEQYIQQKLRCFGLPPIIRDQLLKYRSGLTDQQIYYALLYSEKKLGRTIDSRSGLPELINLPKNAYIPKQKEKTRKDELDKAPIISMQRKKRDTVNMEELFNDINESSN